MCSGNQPQPSPHERAGMATPVILRFGMLRRAATLLPALAIVGYFEFAVIAACVRGNYLYVAIPAAIILGIVTLILLTFVPELRFPPRIVLNANGVDWEQRRKRTVSFPWSSIQATGITYNEYEVRGRPGDPGTRAQQRSSFEKYALELYLIDQPETYGYSAQGQLRRWEVVESTPAYGEPGLHYRISLPDGPSAVSRCEEAIERFSPQSFVGLSRRSWRHYRKSRG